MASRGTHGVRVFFHPKVRHLTHSLMMETWSLLSVPAVLSANMYRCRTTAMIEDPSNFEVS